MFHLYEGNTDALDVIIMRKYTSLLACWLPLAYKAKQSTQINPVYLGPEQCVAGISG
jgi:hypothetical protein